MTRRLPIFSANRGLDVMRTALKKHPLIGLLGQGFSIGDVLADYSTLCREDVLAALRFAASAVAERELPLRLSA